MGKGLQREEGKKDDPNRKWGKQRVGSTDGDVRACQAAADVLVYLCERGKTKNKKGR